MNGRMKFGLAVAMVAIAGVAAVAMAATEDGGEVPRGPEVDFCPTPDQTEAHLKQYGFDYKPTVECSVDEPGDSDPSGAEPTGDDALSGPEADKYYDEQLKDAKPLPDSDGDPTTIEGKLSDGREVTVILETSNPEQFRGMDIDEYAAGEYP